MFELDGRTDPAGLVDAAVRRGHGFLVAVGEDHVAHAVLNGIVRGDRPLPDVLFGVLAANSGSDIVRTFGLWQDPALAVDRLVRGLVYHVDVGKASASTRKGVRTQYFLNMAQVGLGGLAARRGRSLRMAPERLRRFAGFWGAMATYRRPVIRMQGDRRTFEGAVTNVILANMQFTANGMHVSPRSWPEDGYLDLQVFTGPRSDAFTLLPKMFVGEHLPHPNVLELRSTTARIESDRAVPVEVDGEPIGTTPVTFEVLHRALPFKV